jgi:hypothetical protein
VDGRHRLQVCQQLGITPVFTDLEIDEADLLPFVMSMNLARRHLTVGQRAALGARVEAYLSTFTKARQLSTLKRGNGLPVVERFPQRAMASHRLPGKAREEAGRQVHVSGRSISAFKALEREAPELATQVAAGEITLNDAHSQAFATNGQDDCKDQPELELPPYPEEPEPGPTLERLPKPNARLMESWLWPDTVEDFVKSRMQGRTLNVPCGASTLGDVFADLEPRRDDVIRADMKVLPFNDESFDTVISDPPWRINWFDRWKPCFSNWCGSAKSADG